MITKKSSFKDIFNFYENKKIIELNDFHLSYEDEIIIQVWKWNLSKTQFGKSISFQKEKICVAFAENSPIYANIYYIHNKIYTSNDHNFINLTVENFLPKIKTLKTFL